MAHNHKDTIWNVPPGSVNLDQAQLAVLMDIRDELKSIRKRLDCDSTVMMPVFLTKLARAAERIDKRLGTKIKLK